MPGLLDIVLGYDCNLACDYCTITASMRLRALTPPRLRTALLDARQAHYDTLSLTGGEPTIRPDLLPLIKTARSLGFHDIKLQSNALMLAPAGNAARLVAAGVTRFHLSIHTHRPDRYDAMVRRADTYPLMVQGLSAAVATDRPVVAEVILKQDTYRDLPDALRWLRARGIRRADLWFVSLTDANAAHPESMPRMTDVVPAMAEAFAFARAHAMEVRSLHVPRCLLGPDHPHAHDPGAARVRVVTPEATFELSRSRLTGQQQVPACVGCRFEDRCPGLRPDYLARYGDAEIARARGQAPTIVGTVSRSLPVVPDEPALS